MLDLKQRFTTLDQMPAPDLERVIERRAQYLASVPGALGPIDEREMTRRRFRVRGSELLAAAAVLLLAIGLAVFVHQARTVGPVKHQPSPSPPGAGASSLYATMRMISPSIGWMSIGPEPNLILRNDQGHQWSDEVPWFDMTPRQAISGGQISPVFLDGTSAWILSVPPNDTSGRADIWRTLDGGQSWQRAASLSVVPWYSGARRADRLMFVDHLHGWLSASISSGDGLSMVIYQTTDGGVHWTEVSVPSGFPGHSTNDAIAPGCAGGLTFTSQNDGWVPAGCQRADRLFYTHDGGRTWKEQTLPDQLRTFSGSEYHFQAFVSASQDGGFVYTMFGNARTSVLYLSQDNGATWSERPLPASSVPEQIPPVFVGNNGWFFARGMLYATHDRGRRWTKVDARTDGWTLSQLQFLDPTRGWAIATRAGRLGLVKTVDGGRLWSLEWISP